MFSKSIPDRSEPQFGIGFCRNSSKPFSRRSSIHCGSLFLAEDIAHDVLVQDHGGIGPGRIGVRPAVAIADKASSCSSCDMTVDTTRSGAVVISCFLFVLVGLICSEVSRSVLTRGAESGMCVVQTPSP